MNLRQRTGTVARVDEGRGFGPQLSLWVALNLAPLICAGQNYTSDAVSREVSVFNDGMAGSAVEAVSREISVFNGGVSGAAVEAVSREVSVFNDGTISSDNSSREVSVFNYGDNQLELTVGSTALRSGDSGRVPVTLFSLAPLTNVQLVVGFPANRLTNWTIEPTLRGDVLVTNGNQLYLDFAPSNQQAFFLTQELGHVSFTAVRDQPSAFLELPIADATGTRIGGTDAPRKFLQDGEVVVINSNPLLRARLAQSNNAYRESLTLYGLPGTNYVIESTTDLDPPVVWTPVDSLTPPGFMMSIGDLENTNAAIFYRARQ
jgi:hypothetical protein